MTKGSSIGSSVSFINNYFETLSITRPALDISDTVNSIINNNYFTGICPEILNIGDNSGTIMLNNNIIVQQANSDGIALRGTVINNNIIANNYISGDGTIGGAGIKFASGSQTNTIVVNNRINNFGTGIFIGTIANRTITAGNNTFGCATGINDNGVSGTTYGNITA